MEKLLNWLKTYGTIGSAVATSINLLVANWPIAMSSAFGLIIVTWSKALEIAQTPAIQLGVAGFLASLWTIIGITVLVDRRRPTIIKQHRDYAYGLTFEGLTVGIDIVSEDAYLQVGVQLRNFSPQPIKYEITEFDVRIGNRALPKILRGALKAYIPRGGMRHSRTLPFSRNDLKDFFGKQVEGTFDATIVYGHPEDNPQRQLKISSKLHYNFNEMGLIGLVDNILDEVDQPL